MIPKTKPIRLKGKAYEHLCAQVFERQQQHCICGKFVSCYAWDGKRIQGPHHIVYKSKGGDDSLGNLILLCFDCHRDAHRHVVLGEHCSKVECMETLKVHIKEVAL